MRTGIRLFGRGLHICWKCIGLFALWTVWLLLAVLIVVHSYIAFCRELEVPRWILRRVETRLADHGLRASFGKTSFDPTGRILVEDVTVSSTTFDEPLASAQALSFKLDPWLLPIGIIVPDTVEVIGGALHVPAMLSASGQNQRLVRDLEFRAHLRDRSLRFDHASARLLNIDVILSGQVDLEAFQTSKRRPRTPPSAEILFRQYLQITRRVLAAAPWFERLEDPQLKIALRPSEEEGARAHLELHLAGARLPAAHEGGKLPAVDAQEVALTTDFPFLGLTAKPLVTRFTARELHVHGTQLRGLDGNLTARISPSTFYLELERLETSLSSLTVKDWTIRHVTVDTPLPTLQPAVTANLAGTDWEITARDLSPASGDVDLHLRGTLNPALLGWADRASGRKASEILTLRSTPEISFQVSLRDGWRYQNASGRLAVGSVVARRVELEGANALFEHHGTRLRFEDIVLRQQSSLARGSYEMDTTTRDYRFLLTGRLQPLDIGGWFSGWWPRFWSNFDFRESTPFANIDIRGRWGSPEVSTIFVGVENAATGIRGTRFDSVATRLFIRPNHYDNLGFVAHQGERHARGTFTRHVNLEKDKWEYMTFDVVTNLGLVDGARIFEREGFEIVEPFTFAIPPQLRIAGRLDSPTSPRGEHRNVSIAGHSTGEFSYYGFPLRDLSFIGKLEDDKLTLDPITVGFAQGTSNGRVVVSGKTGARELGFDVRLSGAVLGETIRTLEDYGAKRKNETRGPDSRFQQKIAAGLLDVALSAEGKLDDLFSFHGEGYAELRGAELAEVHLLWVLSQVLNRTFLNFSTLTLDTVKSNFELQGNKLAFSQLRITGPRAAIEAHGDYFLDHKTLDMRAKLYPFEESNFLLSSAVGFVLTPLSRALEFKLTGRLDKPDWSFVYGPTNLFRSIIGGGSSAPTEATDPKQSPLGRMPPSPRSTSQPEENTGNGGLTHPNPPSSSRTP